MPATPQRALRMARQLQVGSVAINDHLWPFFSPFAPWGGVKASGVGFLGGEWGLLSMTTPKAVSFERLNLKREFYWYPVSAWLYPFLRELIEVLYGQGLLPRLRSLGGMLNLMLSLRRKAGK
jgi:hypothetical protein